MPGPEATPLPGASAEGAEPAACPGCGAVLASAPGLTGAAGAAAACRRLFEETTRELRERSADARAAATVALADTTYAAQHPDPEDPAGVHAVVDTLVRRLSDDPNPDPAPQRPTVWQMTAADVAAGLDTQELDALVDTWARTVAEDWSRAARSSAGI